MRILFLSHYFPPEVNAPATRTFDHCTRWAAAGHDVTVVTCNPNCPTGIIYPGYRNRVRWQTETVDGVRVVRVWTYIAANRGTVRRIANYVSFMLSAIWTALWLPRPDVVVATSPQFFCGWAGVIVSWLRWRPLVLEIRDIWPESIEAVGAMRANLALRFLAVLERCMYRAANHIVPVGNGYRDNILAKMAEDRRPSPAAPFPEGEGSRSSKITVITNGVDLKRFVPRGRDEDLRRQWKLADKFVCSYVGTIGMAHGLEVVIEAAKTLKARGRTDIAFCLVGDGAHRKKLEAQARAADVSDLVVFAGRCPKEQVPAVLASSDACLIHLKGCELFGKVIPSKIFETMAMGRPIIMGVRGESHDIVMEAHAGISMEPDSVESLLQAVETLADNPDLGRKLGRFARDFVAEHFNRDVLAARYLRLLERVAGEEARVLPAPAVGSRVVREAPVVVSSAQRQADSTIG